MYVDPKNGGVLSVKFLAVPVYSKLLVETLLVFIIAVLAVKGAGASLFSDISWLLGPLILVIAALVPAKIRHRKFADFGFQRRQIVTALAVVGGTCIAVFPLAFCGLWVLRSFDTGLPPPSSIPQERGWIGWLFYQFMYVAIAEEVFFRGYLQNNVLRLAQPLSSRRPRLRQWLSVVISATCFALAHVVVHGRTAEALTFLPGLVLGWLFIRTGSLLAPILFHGMANVCYVLIVGMFE